MRRGDREVHHTAPILIFTLIMLNEDNKACLLRGMKPGSSLWIKYSVVQMIELRKGPIIQHPLATEYPSNFEKEGVWQPGSN